MKTRRDAIKAVFRHPAPAGAFILCQLLVRCIAVLPLWFPLAFPGICIPAVLSDVSVRAAFTGALYILLVWPCRFTGARTLLHIISTDTALKGSTPSYPHMLRAGCYRALKAALFGIPLYCLLFIIYRYVFILDASQYASALQTLGCIVLPSSNPARQQLAGLISFLVFFSLSLLLQIFGWYRDIPFDYLQRKGSSVSDAAAKAKAIRIRQRKALILNALADIILFLFPSILAVLLMRWSSTGFGDILLPIYNWLYFGIPPHFPFSFRIPVFCLVLFMLLLPFRKCINAMVVSRYGL